MVETDWAGAKLGWGGLPPKSWAVGLAGDVSRTGECWPARLSERAGLAMD